MFATQSREMRKPTGQESGRRPQADTQEKTTTQLNPSWHTLATRIPTGGNTSLGAALFPAQAKLAISQPGDPFEQEADRVADHVMRMPEPALQRKCAACAPETPCPQCSEEKIQRKTAPGYSSEASTSVSTAIASPGGAPLSKEVRSYFEPRLAHDFSRVRVHDDTRAAELADHFDAHAFTVGQHIFFGTGKFTPDSDSGRRLLAHELVHTQQQSQNPHGAGSGASLYVQRGGKNPTPTPKSCGGWTCAPASDCPNPDGKSAPTPTASTSWSLTVKLDLDVPKADDIVTANDVGHAYVEFNESNGDKYTYGHYHNKTKTPDPVFSPQVPGCTAHPDSTHSQCVDQEVKYTLTDTEYKKALAFAQTWCSAGQPYHILTNNCATFVSNVASVAGKTLPSSRGSVGHGAYNADNPNTLFDAYVSQTDNATWRGRVSGKFTGHYDASGSVVAFTSFKLSTDEKFAVAAKYSYVGSTGDTVDGTLDGRLIFNVDGSTKAVNPIVKFKWSEPSGTGFGVWIVGTTGDLKGTWGRGTADSGAGGWELTKIP